MNYNQTAIFILQAALVAFVIPLLLRKPLGIVFLCLLLFLGTRLLLLPTSNIARCSLVLCVLVLFIIRIKNIKVDASNIKTIKFLRLFKKNEILHNLIKAIQPIF